MVAQGKAGKIIEEAIVRLKLLNLNESNDIFSENNIPSTIKDGSFRVHWLDGTLDLERDALNRQFTIERQMQILVIRSTRRTGSGSKQKSALVSAYDDEETIIKDFMDVRLGTNLVTNYSLASTSTLPTLTNGDNWFITTILFNFEYQLTC